MVSSYESTPSHNAPSIVRETLICADILLVLDNQRCAPRGSNWVEISGLRIFSNTATGGTTLKDLGYRAPIRALLPTLPACREYVASVSSSELCVITGPDPAQRGLDSWFTGTHRGPFIVFFKRSAFCGR